ncbi:hypothetical protein [Cryobacterium sp. TMS1-13-1]|uniref:hypothetical protein n=1 Tax=Cryobacterium sp. TMS1-13-1 TaxID=1259220 RepID=UPI00106B50BA|nr:hypothetical protein [Cryobacterium sp. TMS1-13-1]TFD21365.1 hypothetical protein E3T31_11115 [Cryobacterium sp. TMS1-13-1]
MFELILAATSRTYSFLRRFMPAAIVIDAINTRRGLKWGVPAMLLAVPWALAAIYCRAHIRLHGALPAVNRHAIMGRLDEMRLQNLLTFRSVGNVPSRSA